MSICRNLLCALFIGLYAPAGVAESLPATPTLAQLSRKAGFIFSGNVIKVSNNSPAESLAVPTLLITLRVDQAIRGVKPGETIAFRQLAGVNESREHYRVGERILLFLYPKSKLGLTSPVEGNFGRFEIDGDGRVLLEEARVNALSSDPVLKKPLRRVPAERGAAVDRRLFRKAVVRSIREEQ